MPLPSQDVLDTAHSFDDLPPAEATLLWAMRVWVLGLVRQQDTSARIADAMARLGTPDTQGYLEGFMWALSRGAKRPLEVLCLCRAEVSADERLFLDAVALLQGDEAAEAHALLSTVLSDGAAYVALRSAEAIADGLAGAGIRLLALFTPAPPRVLH